MQSGTLMVQGNLGRHSGEQMTGGRLLIKGSAADWLACGMRGGEIRVLGDAGNNAVGSLPGDRQGMIGGQVIIDGSVGSLAGSRMRRGLLAIGGNAGEATGFELLAGTILIAGQPGPHIGLGMRRGSIVLLDTESFCHEASTYIPPTFLKGGIWRPAFMALLGKYLANTGFSAAQKTAWTDPWQQWHGDSLVGCRGEILTPAIA
jgi:formylmethanofuran dehydrogenase subunit C